MKRTGWIVTVLCPVVFQVLIGAEFASAGSPEETSPAADPRSKSEDRPSGDVVQLGEWMGIREKLRESQVLWIDTKELRSCSLQRPAVSAAGIARLAALQDLRRLACNYAPVGDAACGVAGGLPKLEIVALNDAGVSDAGVKELARSRTIEVLVLDGNPGVTDASVEQLGRMKQLVALRLHDTSISKAGIEKLRKLLPDSKSITD